MCFIVIVILLILACSLSVVLFLTPLFIQIVYIEATTRTIDTKITTTTPIAITTAVTTTGIQHRLSQSGTPPLFLAAQSPYPAPRILKSLIIQHWRLSLNKHIHCFVTKLFIML